MSVPVLMSPSEVSPMRIGAWSTALALHLVAFGLLLQPPGGVPMPVRTTAPDAILAEFIARVIADPKPVSPVPTPPRRTPKPLAPPKALVVPVLRVDSAMVVEATAMEPEASDSVVIDTGAGATSSAAQIAYEDASPPPYPTIAIRRAWQGTVLLRVRVDENGRPRETTIERSSGHALLDRTASRHVLANWSFHPAMQGGQPVAAWARVPVTFRLDRS